MMRDRVLPDQIHNYAHNNEWLIRDLALVGRVHNALDLVKNMIELPRHPKHNTADKNEATPISGMQDSPTSCSNMSFGRTYWITRTRSISSRRAIPRNSSPGCACLGWPDWAWVISPWDASKLPPWKRC